MKADPKNNERRQAVVVVECVQRKRVSKKDIKKKERQEKTKFFKRYNTDRTVCYSFDRSL